MTMRIRTTTRVDHFSDTTGEKLTLFVSSEGTDPVEDLKPVAGLTDPRYFVSVTLLSNTGVAACSNEKEIELHCDMWEATDKDGPLERVAEVETEYRHLWHEALGEAMARWRPA